MHKSTLVLGGLCLFLLIGTGAVVWWWWTLPVGETNQVFEGSLGVGLPAGVPGGGDSGLTQDSSALLWDSESAVIKRDANGFDQRPIASLTKLMTAMVAIDQGLDWEQTATIEPGEYVIGGQLLLHAGEQVTMRDLMHASLMGSANNATLALVRILDLPDGEFVREMNRKAIELGLEQTEFVEVTGLDPKNVSTAYDVARLAEAAWEYPDIAEISSKREYFHVVGESGREHTIINTNNMIVDDGVPLTGSKTGYLYEAGFCLVVRDSLGHIAVVLGSESEWQSMQDVRVLLGL